MSADAVPAYPVRVEGHLDPGLSRWLWLVKWLLVIPHYVVLAFLWTAFAVSSVVAFFAILSSGRYPRGIFDFNVGVLRWSWRVAFYAFAANGTDRYPPFALGEADYPATLAVEYPGRLSRGLVLVKWWLLAIPHYLVVALFVGSGAWFATRADGEVVAGWSGLISVLVLIAVVVLLFTGRYPRGIFDLVLGMNRWVLRVAAYAGLMTDRYPPFRLDMGESEPGAMTVPRPGAVAAGSAAPARAPAAAGGQIALVVVGSIVALVATGLLAAGGVGLLFDQTRRDGQGFLMSSAQRFSTAGHALVSERVEARLDGPDWLAGGPLGTWVAQTTGRGTQALLWKPRDGDWRAVVMAADGGRGVDAELSVGATFPDLDLLSGALLGGGAVLLLVGGTLIGLGARRPGPAS